MAAPETARDLLALVAKSGLVGAARLEAFLKEAGPDQPDTPAGLADFLVGAGLLTRFQARQFLQGKWRDLVLGKYKVLEPLASGGMGTVFLGEQMGLCRRVAIKVLSTAHATQATLQRFYREARAVATLDHPNIVRAYDIDRAGELHYLVLEYVEGINLGDLVQRGGPLEVSQAADYVRQAALGLQAVHEAGWVHRDVKPANLLLTRQGVVKILDLGLARRLEGDADKVTKQHEEKAILGTLDYLAPEQVRNSSEVDGRADIYSLGATLYFLLVGEPPPPEGSVAQKLFWHLTGEAHSVRARRPEVPEELAVVVGRMLAKAPAERCATPVEVAEALAGWSRGPVPPREDLLSDTASAEGPAPVWPLSGALDGVPGEGGEDGRPSPSHARRRRRWLVLFGLLLVAVAAPPLIWLAVRPNLLTRGNDTGPEGPANELAPGRALSPAEAARYVNQTIVLEMEVRSTGLSRSGATVFLNSEGDFQDPENFTVMIPGRALAKMKAGGLKAPQDYFRGKTIRVKGAVSLFNDRPQIVLSDPKQIQTVRPR